MNAYESSRGITCFVMLGGSEWSTSRPGRLTSEKEPVYPSNRKLGGPPSWPGRYGDRKISCPWGRDSSSGSSPL